MVALNQALRLVLALFTASTPAATAETLQWGKCLDVNATAKAAISCANLTVPLDYSDPKSTAKLTLQLLKASSSASPAKGTILFNPGGPGEAGRATLAAGADLFSTMSGHAFDWVSWDIRGSVTTIPYTCGFKSAAEVLFAIKQLPQSGAESDTALAEQWAAAGYLGGLCTAAHGNNTGGLTGTAFNARDMAQIVDALGGDGLLRYYGASYGTALGATFAAMFPDRVGAMALDGNVNMHEYYDGYTVEGLTSTDATFAGLLEGCAANPARCTLAAGNMTAPELSAKVYAMLNTLKRNPVATPAGVLTYAMVESFIFQSLYKPFNWPSIADALDGLVKGNVSVGSALVQANTEGLSSPGLLWNLGISCGDKRTPRASSIGDIAGWQQRQAATGFFSATGAGALAACARWPMHAKEVYSGPWSGIKTKNPLLFIGNTFDPITPLVSARNTSAAFEGSVLLQHDGYGHTSSSDPSNCTMGRIADYFTSGKLPAAGTICPADNPPFLTKSPL